MRSAVLALLLSAVAIATPGSACADDARADEGRRGDARTIATRGDGEFYAGRCDRAIPLWREAEAAYHAPTILLRIARCEAILGHVVKAVTILDAIGKEAIEPDAPPAFFMARDQARREVATVRARVATLEIAVDASERSPVEIDIDGAAQPGGRSSFPVDPGERSVRVRAGASSWQSSVRLRDGERLAVRISLAEGPDPRRPYIQRGLGIAAIGLGSAAVAVGLGLSIDAGAADRPRTFGTAAQATLAAGAILTVAGAITIAAVPSRGDAWRVQIGTASLAIQRKF